MDIDSIAAQATQMSQERLQMEAQILALKQAMDMQKTLGESQVALINSASSNALDIYA